jgi:hypothetical protein
MLVGWLSDALGWKLQRATGGTGGMVSATFQAAGWQPIQVVLRSVPNSKLAEGEVSALRIAGARSGTSFSLTVERDPQRARPSATGKFQRLHPTGGEDEAAMEIAQRRAAKHREVIAKNLESLHHTSTGELPGESVPHQPTVVSTERRRAETSDVMLTKIDIGDAQTLRHVQRVPDLSESAMLLELLSSGARDPVYNRALAAAADFMRKL